MFMESMADNYSVFRLVLFQIWIQSFLLSRSHAQNALLPPQVLHHPSSHGCGFPGSHLNSKVTLQQPVPRDGGGHNPPTLFPLPVGTTAVYTCEEPYITLGEPLRICRPDFTWSGSTPFCGLNVAMHKPLILPADRFAWLTNDGVISTRARDCYAHSFSAGSTFTWKIDLTENFHIHSLRILALADFAWTANVTLQYVSRNNVPVDVHCGRLDYAGTEQTAAVSVPCRKIVPIRFLRIDFTLLSNGRLRLCEVNVLSVDALTSELCPTEASAKAVVQHACLSFHSHAQATWGGALQTCRRMGGTLMDDIGPQEQTYLQAKLSYLHRFQQTEAFYWVGLFRSVNMSTMEDHWLWTNGNEPVGSFWAPNQPDKVTSRQFCTGLSGRTGWLWNDFNCESGQGFWVCRANFTSCPIPEQPENGLVTMLDRRLGGLVTYHCEEGYDLSGPASRNCLSNGTWSGVLPRCRSTITSMQSTPEMLTRPPMATFVPVLNFTSASAGLTSPQISSRMTVPPSIRLQKSENHTPSAIRTTQTIVQSTETTESLLTTQSTQSFTTSRSTTPPTTVTSTVPLTTTRSTAAPTSSSRLSQPPVETSSVQSTLPQQSTPKAGWILPEASINIPSNVREPDLPVESTTMVHSDVVQMTETTEAEYFAPSVTAKPTIPRPPPTPPRTRKPPSTTSTTTPKSQPLLTFPIGLQNRCNNVPVLFNGRYTVDMMGPMMVARYSCNNNFNLVGIPFLTCTLDGSWRGIMPLCIPGYGPTLIPPVTTRSKTEATRFVPTTTSNFNTLITSLTPQQAKMTPFVRAGPSTTAVSPVNQEKQTVINQGPESEFNQTASHETGQPYNGVTHTASQTGRPTTTATRPPFASPSADPSRPAVTLPPPGCPPLPVVEYAEMLYQRNTIFFRCLPGYVLVGNNSTQCLPEGVWDSLPDCFPVDCGQPEKLSNGMVMLINGSTTYGSVVAYSCSGQLVTLGIFYRVCGAQGRWEGPTADCVAEIPSLIPAESRQEARSGMSGMMTIIVGVVGTIGGVVIVIAIAISIKCLRSRESIPVAVSPTPYSLPSEHSPRALMTERASADIFSRARYVPSTASSQSGYEFDGSISDASTQTGKLEPRHSL